MIHSIIPEDYIFDFDMSNTIYDREKNLIRQQHLRSDGPLLYRIHSTNLWDYLDIMSTREASSGLETMKQHAAALAAACCIFYPCTRRAPTGKRKTCILMSLSNSGRIAENTMAVITPAAIRSASAPNT